MIEFPEARVLAQQLQQTLVGKTISAVTAASSPHKFAWYHGDPLQYPRLLSGKKILSASSFGGLVQLEGKDICLLFGDGISLRFFPPGEKIPNKHQLLLKFNDNSVLLASVQMYGGLWCFRPGEFDNQYYLVARKKPSPLTKEFTQDYFASLLAETARAKSAKGFLATEQRIPGLGNGVLQDILFNAHIHPKRPISSIAPAELKQLYLAVKNTLRQMAAQGGRDTEKGLFGQRGGYRTILSKNTFNYPCPVCAGSLNKETYLGGSVYYCSTCQPL
mgnify:FL=1|jgi:formamidopyrimidine-DNA glycosylase